MYQVHSMVKCIMYTHYKVSLVHLIGYTAMFQCFQGVIPPWSFIKKCVQMWSMYVTHTTRTHLHKHSTRIVFVELRHLYPHILYGYRGGKNKCKKYTYVSVDLQYTCTHVYVSTHLQYTCTHVYITQVWRQRNIYFYIYPLGIHVMYTCIYTYKK